MSAISDQHLAADIWTTRAFADVAGSGSFAAPIILGKARVVEGEYGTSAIYLSDVADPKRRGFYSSFRYVTLLVDHTP